MKKVKVYQNQIYVGALQMENHTWWEKGGEMSSVGLK